MRSQIPTDPRPPSRNLHSLSLGNSQEQPSSNHEGFGQQDEALKKPAPQAGNAFSKISPGCITSFAPLLDSSYVRRDTPVDTLIDVVVTNTDPLQPILKHAMTPEPKSLKPKLQNMQGTLVENVTSAD